MSTNPTTGRILLAEPGIQDFYFKQSVILLGEMDGDGAFGLIVNKRTNIRFGDVINDQSWSESIYISGRGLSEVRISFLFISLSDLPGCTQITKGVYWGGDQRVDVSDVTR